MIIGVYGTREIGRIYSEPAAKPKPVPVAIQRLMDEVRAGDATPHGLFDRGHNRHNR